MTKKDVIKLIKQDQWMMDILSAVEKLGLPDWWIGAGFVRSKVWDYLHGYKRRTPLPDVDVIYFDPDDFSQEEETSFSVKSEDHYQEQLQKIMPSIGWSVTNQARMHHVHNRNPYTSSEEALSEWCETATCIGVCLKDKNVILTAPHGISDLTNLILRPIPQYSRIYKNDLQRFSERISSKNWLKKWPKLRIKLDKNTLRGNVAATS